MTAQSDFELEELQNRIDALLMACNEQFAMVGPDSECRLVKVSELQALVDAAEDAFRALDGESYVATELASAMQPIKHALKPLGE